MEAQKIHKSKLIENLPNFITFLNLFFGIMTILICVCYQEEKYRIMASVFIMISGFFDAIDGAFARKLNVVSDLGKQLDSFADIVSFGVSPMVLAVSTTFSCSKSFIMYVIVFLVATLYITCGIIRLSRYNLGDYKNYFVGLPITIAGLILAIYFLIINILEFRDLELLSILLIFVLSILMVSSIKVHRISIGK
jgi:CDP-diacylglycerol--serine O-phosphatidyltransferase